MKNTGLQLPSWCADCADFTKSPSINYRLRIFGVLPFDAYSPFTSFRIPDRWRYEDEYKHYSPVRFKQGCDILEVSGFVIPLYLGEDATLLRELKK
jgi:hypothetical protein